VTNWVDDARSAVCHHRQRADGAKINTLRAPEQRIWPGVPADCAGRPCCSL